MGGAAYELKEQRQVAFNNADCEAEMSGSKDMLLEAEPHNIWDEPLYRTSEDKSTGAAARLQIRSGSLEILERESTETIAERHFSCLKQRDQEKPNIAEITPTIAPLQSPRKGRNKSRVQTGWVADPDRYLSPEKRAEHERAMREAENEEYNAQGWVPLSSLKAH